jgi:glutathionylspermidine synthase
MKIPDDNLVLAATSELEAEVVKQRLLEDNITSIILNRDPTGMFTLNPMMVSEYKVFVSTEDAERAYAIITTLEDDIDDDMEFVEGN